MKRGFLGKYEIRADFCFNRFRFELLMIHGEFLRAMLCLDYFHCFPSFLSRISLFHSVLVRFVLNQLNIFFHFASCLIIFHSEYYLGFPYNLELAEDLDLN